MLITIKEFKANLVFFNNQILFIGLSLDFELKKGFECEPQDRYSIGKRAQKLFQLVFFQNLIFLEKSSKNIFGRKQHGLLKTSQHFSDNVFEI